MKLKSFLSFYWIAVITLLASAAHGQTFSVIHNFVGSGVDGAFPKAGITLHNGSLYGTTSGGGEHGSGVVYQVKSSGDGWLTFPIYYFQAGNDGLSPNARIIFGPDGNPYGTAALGGPYRGTVFNLTISPTICKTVRGCGWNYNILHEFTGGDSDGSQPSYGDLFFDQAGNIDGTTFQGGPGLKGTVYQLARSGSTWNESILHFFTGAPDDGADPQNGVISDANGNLFGTTAVGGQYDSGTVFELAYVNGQWTEKILYSFQNGNDGSFPIAGLVFDKAGNLYGAAAVGGSAGGGNIFELSPVGDSWSFNVLYSFSGGPGGCGPNASLTMDNAGSLYGTTYCDGPISQGNVFKLTNTGNGWNYVSLHDFSGRSDGRLPISNVTIGPDGTLYGTTMFGGATDLGVVWMIKP
jgi:uncharacterized repeat protein (TIGR03803 family)